MSGIKALEKLLKTKEVESLDWCKIDINKYKSNESKNNKITRFSIQQNRDHVIFSFDENDNLLGFVTVKHDYKNDNI